MQVKSLVWQIKPQDIVGTVVVLWAFCLCFIDCYKDWENLVMVDACRGGGGFKDHFLIIQLVQVIMINTGEGLYPHTHE